MNVYSLFYLFPFCSMFFSISSFNYSWLVGLKFDRKCQIFMQKWCFFCRLKHEKLKGTSSCFLFSCQTSQSFAGSKHFCSSSSYIQLKSNWIATVSDQTWQKNLVNFVPLFTSLLLCSWMKYILHVTVYALCHVVDTTWVCNF